MMDISTKDRILEAALTVFSEKGYDGIAYENMRPPKILCKS